MNAHLSKLFSILLVATISFGSIPIVRAQGSQPNIIFILTDDLGYGDVGVLYQNSRPAGKPRMSTPNLDQMAAEGMIFRQHYTGSPVCAPARASLLLGQHQGNCALRDNHFVKTLPNNHTLATVLKQAGYHTAVIGKYGLSGPAPEYPSHPLRRGFDEFYGMLEHWPSRFHYPGNSGRVTDNYTRVTNGLDHAYDTDLYAARAKKYIIERAANPSQPFFLYLAFTAPHFYEELPTQAYPAGGGLNGGLKWPLNTNTGRTNSWYHPDYAHQNWPDVEKRHATMIRRVDDAVADIIQLLKDLQIDTNTLVIFTSDNGPHNEHGQDPRFFDSWGPMDGIKRDLWEAGIREPMIVRWPGHVPANSISDVVSGFWDWMPTFAELGGLAPPAQADGVSLVPTLTGVGEQRSRGFLYFEYSYFGADFPVDADIFRRKDVTGRGQLQAIRMGDFTAVRYMITNADEPFRLYNVVEDPHEDQDLAGYSTNAARVAMMAAMTRGVRRPEPGVPRPYDRDLVPAVTVTNPVKATLDYSVYQGPWPWVPDFDALAPISTGRAAGLDTGVGNGQDNIGISFKGYIEVPVDGQYTFYLTSDSGAQMWIHEAHVIDDDFNHTGAEVSASILLKAGLHPIRIFYRHKTGAATLDLEYSGPGFENEQLVPASVFSSE